MNDFPEKFRQRSDALGAATDALERDSRAAGYPVPSCEARARNQMAIEACRQRKFFEAIGLIQGAEYLVADDRRAFAGFIEMMAELRELKAA
jgi:hypothetical protein